MVFRFTFRDLVNAHPALNITHTIQVQHVSNKPANEKKYLEYYVGLFMIIYREQLKTTKL